MKSSTSIHDDVFCSITIEISPEELKNYTVNEAGRKDMLFPSHEHASIEELSSDLISSVLKEADLHPVSRPKLSSPFEHLEGGAYRFSAEVEILPQISFPQNFSDIELPVKEPLPSQAKIFKNIEKILRPLITLKEVTEFRTPQDGDIVELLLRGNYEDTPVIGLEQKRMTLALDSFPIPRTFSEIEPFVRNLHTGESVDCQALCPINYPDLRTRGKYITLNITLQKIFKRNFPVLTDHIAKQLGFTSAEELKGKACMASMNESILEQKKIAQDKLLDLLIENTKFSIPPSVERFFLQQEMNDVHYFLEKQKTDPQQAKEAWKTAYDALLPEAKIMAARHTYLLSYAYAHGISISSDILDNHIKKLAKNNGQSPEQVRKKMEEDDTLDMFEECFMAEKALDMIYSKIKKVMTDQNGKIIPEAKI